MLTAFSCVTNDTIPETMVTISSFRRHNPRTPVVVYHERGTDVRLIEALGVEVIPVGNCHLLLSGIDHLLRKRKDITGRVVYLSSNTLVRSDLSDFGTVDLGETPIAVQHWWSYPGKASEGDVYQTADPVGEPRRQAFNDRYFNTDFMLLDVDQLRVRNLPLLTPAFVRSYAKTEEELINEFFSDKSIVYMPNDLGISPEQLIADTLSEQELISLTSALRVARVVVYSDGIKPWSVAPIEDRCFLQVPFKAYLEEIVAVESMLPVEFVENVATNTVANEKLIYRLFTKDEPLIEVVG